MTDENRIGSLYKNIIGDTKSTIEAIQRYLFENSSQNNISNSDDEIPAESINRVLRSVFCDETNSDIQKIINNL